MYYPLKRRWIYKCKDVVSAAAKDAAGADAVVVRAAAAHAVN
jgi:hypothetical protein